jgi:hypothetical protein
MKFVDTEKPIVEEIAEPVLSAECSTPSKGEPSAYFDAIVANRRGSPIRRNLTIRNRNSSPKKYSREIKDACLFPGRRDATVAYFEK